MNNNSEQIGRYLQNEMTAEERTAFEKQIAVDKDLLQEILIQEQIINAAKTVGLKNTFGKAIRRNLIGKRLIQFGAGAIILIAATFVFYAIKTNLFSTHGENDRTNIENVERITINNAADTIIETDDGVVFAIPAHAFDSKSGKLQLEIKTAIRPYDIIRQGLSTESNGSLLQTAGMFYINGYEDGKPVGLVKNIDVSVPANKIDPAMKLFDGVMDSSGKINWVNPKPIENNLRTYDITTLDFYPPNYIPALKALEKDYANKKYTDSLYYSFSGYGYGDAGTRDILKLTKDSAGVITMIKSKEEVERDYARQDFSTRRRHSDTVRYEGDYTPYHEIDPARIKAIWDKKFNNTIIATKEFEERLQYMHSICRPLFLVYLQNLNKPMNEIDQFIADNVIDIPEVQHKFLDFAARKDGSVLLKEGMQQELSNYFEKKFKAYREAQTKTFANHEQELARLAAIADDKRREQETKDFLRDNNNFNEEFCINLTNAYNQIGIKRRCDDTIPPPPPTNYYNVTIDTVGWKNLDVYVFDATTNRESMTYTDPVTGKTASLTYKEVNIIIRDMEQFDKVLVYLIPDSLSSFQRIEEQGNVFKEKLNSLFRYYVVAIGYNGDKIFYYKQENLQPGQYIFGLTPTTEKELKGILQKYSGQKSNELKTEFEFQLFEQQEIMRQVQLRKDDEFREKIAAAIFSCGEDRYWVRPLNSTVPIASSTDSTKK